MDGWESRRNLAEIGDDLVIGVRDEVARRAILSLLKVLQIGNETIRQLEEENQRLRDENNRLK